jgi:hypothetical protein
MHALTAMRGHIAPFMTAFLWLNAAIAVALSYFVASAVQWDLLAAAVLLALAPTLALLASRSSLATRLSHSAALALYPALFLAILPGSPYQGDIHHEPAARRPYRGRAQRLRPHGAIGAEHEQRDAARDAGRRQRREGSPHLPRRHRGVVGTWFAPAEPIQSSSRGP